MWVSGRCRGTRWFRFCRFLPNLQCSSLSLTILISLWKEAPRSWTAVILQKVLAVASRQYTPKALLQGNNDFQLTRGLLGVSL